ncbi:putative interleukin-17 receptor E-like [Takifugu flavidus]|uniref:putative interleukin-17 receptor E-like n=1 Tax=Takifugu flavidus TaxID=433684 RepID=UPI002544126F|nr:putative interleukin-17 receptor E-like [Takifugu flavidus]
MILLAALLVSQCCVSVSAAAGGSAAALERIEDCGTGCSQGLRCRTKPQALFPPPCQDPGESLLTSSVFHNISVTTVMRCEGRQKCSLHLRVSADLRLTAAVHGVSICVAAAGMMADCRTVRFTKASRARMSGMQVKVWNDCTQVSPGQRLEIKVRTVPSYCGVTWTGAYVAPGCAAGDLQQHVPDCITGRLSYDVDADGKLLAVSVSDMLEGHDYHLRLCHKDFICTGAGAHTLIRKEEPVKKALLRFSRPLPCLCIEGWSAITDARRVQVCPFRDRVEELWSGISFDALEGGLSWEPACPVAAVVALCQMREEGGACADLPHASRNASTGKITFGEVGPHPRLCMKFTAASRSWIRCPFANPSFQDEELLAQPGRGHVRLLSQIDAVFSVGHCAEGEGFEDPCQTLETRTWRAGQQEALVLPLPGAVCSSCLQVKRVDVEFAVTHRFCVNQCNQTLSISAVNTPLAAPDLTCTVVPMAVSISTVILLTSLVLLTVYHRRKQKINGKYMPEQQTDSSLECVIPALQAKSECVPHSPQSEKVNLIWD